MPLSEELHLLLCLLLGAVIFVCAVRFSRQVCDGSAGKAICDALLLFALVVYLAVAVPGILHCLNLATMSVSALLMSALLVGLCRGKPQPIGAGWTTDRWIALTAALFAFGFLVAYLWDQRWLPPMATDSLVYQLSTPVFWMQRHTLSIFPTWYWNPANSYAPQCTTAWFVWLLEPFKNDVLARFGQAPALLWIFVLVYRGFSTGEMGIGRNRNGESTTALLPRIQHGRDARATGALIACAAVLSRPLFSEALFAKDDLIVTALFLTAIMSFRQANLRDRFGAWRVGIAVGLALASKYTVLLVCPLFLFLVDAPFRAGWKRRDFAIALGVAMLLAAPWYFRNILMTGNPLFPADVRLFGARIFTGLFGTERDQQLRSAGGAWRMLVSTYHSLPVALLVALAIVWIAACVAAGRSLLFDPMRRATVVGSIAVLLLFLKASPHHEVRYLFPLIVLWFDCATLAISQWLPTRWMQLAGGLLLAGISTATSFHASLHHRIMELTAHALIVAAAGTGLVILLHHRQVFRRPVAFIATMAGLGFIYIYWHAYLGLYRDACFDAWAMRYPEAAPAWRFVRSDNVPANATIAFANTQFNYPLYGFNYDREVGYAPTRRGLHSFVKFPRMGDDVPGDLIVKTMTRVMTEDPDRETWLENLKAMNARRLVILRQEMVENPVELRFAESDPSHFAVRYSDDASIIYDIRN